MTYLQKFIDIINCKINIVRYNIIWFLGPLIIVNKRPNDKEKKIIPKTSHKPAIEWLYIPRFFIANSSVKKSNCEE